MFVKDWFPAGRHGVDHHGRVIEWIRIGCSDLPGIVSQVGQDNLIKHAVAGNMVCMDMLRDLSLKDQKMHVGAPLVMDLKGLGRRHFWGVKPFNTMMKTCEPNYPERLGKIFLIRAPWIFPALFNVSATASEL